MLSRVGDSLYWMSRYLERAEQTSRLLLVHLNAMLDTPPARVPVRRARLFNSLHLASAPAVADDYDIMRLLTFDEANTDSIVSCLRIARENARQVRPQISSEMWEHLNQMYLSLRANSPESIWHEGPFVFLRQIRNGSHLFEGITDSTMNHGEGWHFIQTGRYLERALGVAGLLAAHADALDGTDDHPDHERYLDLVSILKSCTAFEAYCKIYTANLVPRQVVELLLLNAEFPHSIHFALGRLQTALDLVADATDHRRTILPNRLAGRLKSELSYDPIDEIVSGGLGAYLRNIQQQCAAIHIALHQTYIAYPIQNALPG